MSTRPLYLSTDIFRPTSCENGIRDARPGVRRSTSFTLLRHAQMKLLLLSLASSLLLLLAWSSASAFAQNAGNAPDGSVPPAVSATIEQVTPDIDAGLAITTVERSQSLFGRDSFLNQFNGPTDLGNAARISQTGDENLAVLRQFGGTGNVASISILGNENDISAVQDGSNNRLGLAIEGDFNTVPVTQIGVGHELSLELTGSNLKRGIVQEGTGTIPLYIQIRPGNQTRPGPGN
jgi:hypothetical protein